MPVYPAPRLSGDYNRIFTNLLDAPWYVSNNMQEHDDTQMSAADEEKNKTITSRNLCANRNDTVNNIHDPPEAQED